MRWRQVAFVAALALAGCGDEVLESEYGALNGHSINGLRVLHETCRLRLDVRDEWRLGKRCENADALLHVRRSSGLPDEDSVDWLLHWLDQRPGRCAVLVLRDGDLAPELCRRWSGEAEALAAASDDDHERARYRELADRFDTEAFRTDDHAPGENSDDALGLELVPRPRPVQSLQAENSYPALDSVPELLRVNLVPEGSDWKPLLLADDRPLLVESRIGGGRMLIMANASALLDGALPDPSARAFLDAFVQHLGGLGQQDWVWLHGTAIGDPGDSAPNILALLLSRPPYNWILGHLLLCGLALVLWRNLQLGRRSPPRVGEGQRFARHLAALGSLLQRGDGPGLSARLLARWFEQPPPSPGDDLLRTVQHYYFQDDTGARSRRRGGKR